MQEVSYLNPILPPILWLMVINRCENNTILKMGKICRYFRDLVDMYSLTNPEVRSAQFFSKFSLVENIEVRPWEDVFYTHGINLPLQGYWTTRKWDLDHCMSDRQLVLSSKLDNFQYIIDLKKDTNVKKDQWKRVSFGDRTYKKDPHYLFYSNSSKNCWNLRIVDRETGEIIISGLDPLHDIQPYLKGYCTERSGGAQIFDVYSFDNGNKIVVITRHGIVRVFDISDPKNYFPCYMPLKIFPKYKNDCDIYETDCNSKWLFVVIKEKVKGGRPYTILRYALPTLAKLNELVNFDSSISCNKNLVFKKDPNYPHISSISAYRFYEDTEGLVQSWNHEGYNITQMESNDRWVVCKIPNFLFPNSSKAVILNAANGKSHCVVDFKFAQKLNRLLFDDLLIYTYFEKKSYLNILHIPSKITKSIPLNMEINNTLFKIEVCLKSKRIYLFGSDARKYTLLELAPLRSHQVPS